MYASSIYTSENNRISSIIDMHPKGKLKCAGTVNVPVISWGLDFTTLDLKDAEIELDRQFKAGN